MSCCRSRSFRLSASRRWRTSARVADSSTHCSAACSRSSTCSIASSEETRSRRPSCGSSSRRFHRRASDTASAPVPASLSGPSRYDGIFRADEAARAVYAEAAGIGRVVPRAVAVPSSSDDVAALVEWAVAEGQPIIPRGSGSSMAGGAIGDGVVVDLSRLRDLGVADVDGRCIKAGAGVLRAEIERRAAQHQLRFPVDPSSGAFCTIGGMAATNAAGPLSLRHGAMRPWVLAIECVLADGSRATIRRGEPPPHAMAPVRRFMQTVHPELLQATDSSVDRVLKNSSGYSIDSYRQTHELIDLLVGSEGTLALFTAVEVALAPAAAGAASLFVAFRDLEHAVEAAVASRESSSVAACELLDRTFLTLAAEA